MYDDCGNCGVQCSIETMRLSSCGKMATGAGRVDTHITLLLHTGSARPYTAAAAAAASHQNWLRRPNILLYAG